MKQNQELIWLHITPEIKIMVYYGLGHLDKWKNRDKSYAKHELPAKPRGELNGV